MNGKGTLMSKFILSIDQGTTGTTVSILNHAGILVAKHNQEFPQIFPKPGWVEHNPEDIWKSTITSIKKCLEISHLKGSEIAAIGITNQRETVVIWDRKTGAPVYNAIVWQCRRTEDFCQKLRKSGWKNKIAKKTGLVIDPYFSGSKIRWILKNVKGVQARASQGQLLAGTMDTYLLWKLTSGRAHKTDVSNASRTMLMNINTTDWDKELLQLFGVTKNLLPEICDSSGVFGQTEGLGFLPDGIPISGIAGDQQAALFGQTCFAVGDVKCTYGTGSFILLNTGNKIVRSKHQLLSTVAWRLKGQKTVYALEGGAFICGAAVQWLRDGLQIITKSKEIEALARQVDSSQGVEFVPALTGLGAPYWSADARGLLCGMTRGTGRAHIARATLDAMALQNVDILEAMKNDLGKKLKSIKVDGGASENDLLMQLQADYMGIEVVRPQSIETTSIGAAYLAGLGIGFWKDVREIQKIWRIDQEFQPLQSSALVKKRKESWKKAISKTLLSK